MREKDKQQLDEWLEILASSKDFIEIRDVASKLDQYLQKINKVLKPRKKQKA